MPSHILPLLFCNSAVYVFHSLFWSCLLPSVTILIICFLCVCFFQPKPKQSIAQRLSPRPLSQLKVTSQQSGVELQKRSFTKKEGSPKKFAITGAYNTTVPVPLLKRPIPPAKQLLNLPVASPRNFQEDEERSSVIAALPQQMKSRPTTRASMQTSEGMSKSSFQQYILATADYMRTSSEPFSMVSGSPLNSRAQSQTPGKQIPLRVQSLPDFCVYSSREVVGDDNGETASDMYSRQQSLRSAGSQSAVELDGKRQSRALKLEVDLRDATRLVSTEAYSEITSTSQVRQEQTATPLEQSELPTVNVIESQTPHPNVMYDQSVTVADGIHWDQQSGTDNLVVSDAITESSSTVTLKDDDLTHSSHQHAPSYSDSLRDGQSTADRSLTFDQGSSQICSDQDLGEDDFLGSISFSNIATDGIDGSLRAQTDMGSTNADAVLSRLPDHLDNAPVSMMTGRYLTSTLTANIGSDTAPPSQQSHIGLTHYCDPLLTPVLKETSVSAPAVVDSSIAPDRPKEDNTVTDPPQPETTGVEPTPEHVTYDHDGGDLLTSAVQHESTSSVSEEDVLGLQATTGLSLEEKESSASLLQQTETGTNVLDAKCDDSTEQDDSEEPLQPSEYSSTDKDTYSQVNALSGLHLADSDPNLVGDSVKIEKCTSDAVAKPAFSWSEQIMEKLLNNQADDVPAQSLAVSCSCSILVLARQFLVQCVDQCVCVWEEKRRYSILLLPLTGIFSLY